MSVYNGLHEGHIVGSARVRILPGTAHASSTTPPPPPSSPPPKPAHICKIAVLGDARSGKSSLVQKFIFRKYANSRCDKDEEACNDDTNLNGTASAMSNSVGTSFGAASCDRCEPTLADYHKKDITIWGQTKQNYKHNGGHLKPIPVCIRVQCWDMNICRHHVQTEQDIYSCPHSIISGSSPPHNTNISPLLSLITEMNGIMIVCRSPLSRSYTSQSSSASFASHTSSASCSEWPELDSLEEQIRRWTSFLQGNGAVRKHRHSTICVFLTCADLATADYSPREWMQLTVRMQDICEGCSVDSWKLGTCIDASSLYDVDFLKKQQSSILKRMMQQQSQLLEDLEDAFEQAFIDVILVNLDQGSRLTS